MDYGDNPSVIGGTGFTVDLAPGESRTVPVVGGTARCDGGIGSALAPGNQVIVRVAPEAQRQTPAFLTPQSSSESFRTPTKSGHQQKPITVPRAIGPPGDACR